MVATTVNVSPADDVNGVMLSIDYQINLPR